MKGITHIPSFDIYARTRVENREAKNCEPSKVKTVECVVRRMKESIRGTQNRQAQKWYGDTLQEAERQLQQQSSSKPDTPERSPAEECSTVEEEQMRETTPPKSSGEAAEGGGTTVTVPAVSEDDVTLAEKPGSETIGNPHEKRSPQDFLENASRETKQSVDKRSLQESF